MVLFVCPYWCLQTASFQPLISRKSRGAVENENRLVVFGFLKHVIYFH